MKVRSYFTVLALLGFILFVADCSRKMIHFPIEQTEIQFGGKYDTLKPEQQKLIDAYTAELNRIFGTDRVPAEAYNSVPISVRTTFEAVTHALMSTPLTDKEGKIMGDALDLVEAVEDVNGRVPNARGDLQFRVYVVLVPGAVDQLEESQEFSRGHDNTHFHMGFPINYRLDSTPSLQFSISRNLERADIDVDYRSSSFPAVLFDGHLTSANSDVRAGRNYQTHVGRWEGFMNWWGDIFGFPTSSTGTSKPSDADPDWGIPVVPKVSGKQPLDVAVKDFLNTWLIDHDPKQAMAYFSREAFDCVLAFEEEAETTDFAPIRVFREMQLISGVVGSPATLEEVAKRVEVSATSLKLMDHSDSNTFALYSVPSAIVNNYSCPALKGFQQIDHAAGHKQHYLSSFRIVGKPGESEELFLMWANEAGYWRIHSFHLGPPDHSADVPSLRSQTAELDLSSPLHPSGNPELVTVVQGFFSKWFIQHDYEAAETYFAIHSHDCSNLLLDSPDGAVQTPDEAGKQIMKGLRQIVESVPRSSKLEDMLEQSRPWNPDVYVIQHPDQKAYLLASVPASVSGPLSCQQRTKAPQIHSSLPPHSDDVYLTAFHLKSGINHPPIFFLLWAQEGDSWKVVSFHVERN